MSVWDRGDDLMPRARGALPASLAHALDWLNNRLDEPIQLEVSPRQLQSPELMENSPAA